jgi:hypothetical protein
MRSRQVVVLMAGGAFLSGDSVAFPTPQHVHGMGMSVISLTRKIALRMAIHAARMPQDRDESREQRPVARGGCGRSIGFPFSAD